ncbi:M4 family metallopeptidase [Microbacterium sp. QXD-8]|uniref:M4 family metallopeptidase n=1 Tax=Microbacterium psychrotolerans TaxID=3068321 RepID=A0ABU0Z6A7_9MICO|nr:M4 family metallopeptidase [Microbacterium sp. QXD-8]MDQ7880119.1 M4 family metallopeptidase [Microbacterium sp. QXD-8]
MHRPAKLAACSALVGTALVLASVVPAAASADPAPSTVAAPASADPDSDTPTLVDGIAEPTDAKGPADKAALAHLKAKKDRYHIPSAETNLVVSDVTEAGSDETVRFTQRHGGVEVLGGQYIVRMKKKEAERIVTGTSGQYFTDLTVGVEPKISSELAVARAVQAVQYGGKSAGTVGGETTAALTGADQGLVVLPQGAGILTRHVTVRGTDAAGAPVVQEVYIEATTGLPTLQYSGIQTFGIAGVATPAAGATATAAAEGDAADGTGTLLTGVDVPVNLTHDAASGAFLLRDTTRPGTAIETYDAAGVVGYSYPTGTIPAGVELASSPTAALGAELTTTGAVDAHWGAGQVYDYYKNRLGRDSIDGEGQEIRSLVGLVAWEGGTTWNQAYWDGYQMAYGAGDGWNFKPFTADLDVQGHELTHGVVQHTAGLVYVGQSGALNEAFADYFGNAIDVDATGTPLSDPNASLLGEDLCYAAAPTACALRDLDDGTTIDHFAGYPYFYDAGGVHLNSTIFGGALWDIREALGGETADPIVYRALTDYLTPLDGFTQARDAVLAAAKAQGLKGKQLKSVQAAFDTRGIKPGWEKQLGGDGTVLFENLTDFNGVSWAGAGGGWWTIADVPSIDGSGYFGIYAGTIDRKVKPTLVSTPGEWTDVYPDTDGKTVVWIRFSATGSQVMAKSLAGGPEQVVYTTPTTLFNARVSDGVVAWDGLDVEGSRRVGFAKLGGTATLLPGTATGVPDITGGKLAYVREFPTEVSLPDGTYTRTFSAVEVLDTATGAVTEVGPRTQGSITRPTIAGGSVVWAADDRNDPYSAIRKAPVAGGAWSDVVPESNVGGLHIHDLVASSTTITVTSEGDSERLGSGVPLLLQYTLDGKSLGRVTCSTGFTDRAAADTGSTLVWVDTAASYDTLVTRATPVGTC